MYTELKSLKIKATLYAVPVNSNKYKPAFVQVIIINITRPTYKQH